MIKYINCNKKNYLNKLKYYLSKRSSVDIKKLKIVDKIIKDVKKNGDKALAKYEKKIY